jgi:type II secretory pathway component PulF
MFRHLSKHSPATYRSDVNSVQNVNAGSKLEGALCHVAVAPTVMTSIAEAGDATSVFAFPLNNDTTHASFHCISRSPVHSAV